MNWKTRTPSFGSSREFPTFDQAICAVADEVETAIDRLTGELFHVKPGTVRMDEIEQAIEELRTIENQVETVYEGGEAEANDSYFWAVAGSHWVERMEFRAATA